jgi:hypothetical protein
MYEGKIMRFCDRLLTFIGLMILFTGILTLFGGEVMVVAWIIYDAITLVKSDTATFGACLWLVLMYCCRGTCLGLSGMLLIFSGLSLTKTIK